MEKVEAFKCSKTGLIFMEPKKALQSEFAALFREITRNLPPLGSVQSASIADWFSSALNSGTYGEAEQAFIAAAEFYKANRETLTAR